MSRGRIEAKWDSRPICPYCEYPFDDAWELYLEDGGQKEVLCPECEKEYTILCCIPVEYTTFRKD